MIEGSLKIVDATFLVEAIVKAFSNLHKISSMERSLYFTIYVPLDKLIAAEEVTSYVNQLRTRLTNSGIFRYIQSPFGDIL